MDFDPEAEDGVRYVEEDQPQDMFGHGTACAGIIHSLAPEAELYSVRVLGKKATGRAVQFAGGLRWAVEQGMQVINLSLSTSKEEYYALFHQIADEAYFQQYPVGFGGQQHPGAELSIACIRRWFRWRRTQGTTHSPITTTRTRR